MRNVTYVAYEEFQAIAAELKLPTLEQRGFLKVVGPKGRQVYVAKTRRVGRVDISGFELRDADGRHLPGVVAPHCGEFGNVRQQLDFSLSQAEILANFRNVLQHMASLPEAERKPKPISSTKHVPLKTEARVQSKEQAQAARDARKSLIEKVAKEKGVGVSPKAFKDPEAAEATDETFPAQA